MFVPSTIAILNTNINSNAKLLNTVSSIALTFCLLYKFSFTPDYLFIFYSTADDNSWRSIKNLHRQDTTVFRRIWILPTPRI